MHELSVERHLRVLIQNQFTDCHVVVQAGYRGSLSIHRFIKALKNDRWFLIFEKNGIMDNGTRIAEIKAAIQNLTFASKFSEPLAVTDHQGSAKLLVPVEEATEYLNLWEIEEASQLPTVDELEAGLATIVEELKAARWIHADIRPWNLYFHPSTRKFVVIDWWSSKRMANPSDNFDKADALKLLQLFKGEAILEVIWPDVRDYTNSWNPEWAKRGAPSPGMKAFR